MPIVKLGKEIADSWRRISDEESISPGRVIISLERWQKEADVLRRHKDGLGIVLRSDQPPSLIAIDLANFQLIQLEIPKFGDGRAYSYARILREQMNYKGELRASGNILRDQYIFMLRCGFDSVEVLDTQRIPGFAKAMQEFSVFYQPAADERKPAWQIRHQI